MGALLSMSNSNSNSTSKSNKNIKRILLIEDDKDITELCLQALHEFSSGSSGNKLMISTAENANEAYKLARNQNYDLIWTDYKMPKILGTDFILALRELPAHTNVPIILFTGYIEEARKNCPFTNDIYFVAKEDGIEKAVAIIMKIFATNVDEKTLQSSKLQDEPSNIFSELLDHFVNATSYVVSTMCFAESISFEKINLSNNKSNNKFLASSSSNLGIDIVSVMPIISPTFKSYFHIAFPKQTFLTIVEKMLDIKDNEIKAEFADACSELANIICGHVKIKANHKYNIEKSIPKHILGNNISIPNSGKAIFHAYFKSSIGPFSIGISSSEK